MSGPGPLSPASGTRRWREIGAGVFVRSFPDYRVNVGLIVGSDGALVVDTRASERQGQELKRAVGFITHLPLTVVNTHHHFDHVLGNASFGHADIWGQERCVTRLRDEASTIRAALAAAMPETTPEYTETRIAPPTRTFRDHATLQLGGRTVELLHLGRGHTDNDVVVFVPDAGALFCGDLVEEGAPPSFEDSWPMDWPGTLARMLEMPAKQFVPGHGNAVDRAFVAGQMSEIRVLADLARSARFDGGIVADALPDSPFPGKTGGIAMTRAFAQLAGEI